MNQTGKYTGSTIGKLLTERVAIWSVPLGVIVIAGAFFAGNLMAGNRKTVPTPTVIKPPAVFGVAEPVYTSVPNMTPVREPETDLVISPNPQPKPLAIERPVVRDSGTVQHPESIDSTLQQVGSTNRVAGGLASTNDIDEYRMDSSRPAEPPSVAANRGDSPHMNRVSAGVPNRYPHVSEKPRQNTSLKPPEVAKDDPWNGETRRRYDSFFNDADFRDGHRSGGR